MPDSLSQSIKQKLNGLTKAELLDSLNELPDCYAGTQDQIAELFLHKSFVVDPAERFMIEKRIERLKVVLKKEKINAEILLLAYKQMLEDLSGKEDPQRSTALEELSSLRRNENSIHLSSWSNLKRLLLSEGKFDRLFVLTCGGLLIGTALGQLIGAMIGGSVGITYGLYITFRRGSPRNVKREKNERTYTE